jgi:hypothetical protein
VEPGESEPLVMVGFDIHVTVHEKLNRGDVRTARMH